MYVVRLLMMNVDDGCNVFISKILESKYEERFSISRRSFVSPSFSTKQKILMRCTQ